MRIAYFDCPTGLSGNMILAALINAGLSPAYLKRELRKLKLAGYKLELTKVSKNGFAAEHVGVRISDTKARRTIDDIMRIIDKSSLDRSIKALSKKIFDRLFQAERKAHGHSRMHLHEVGAIDAIVDIVGAAIGFEKLGIREVYCSPLPVGHGPIRHAHGYLPNPAPATSILLKGVPIYKKDIKGELVTPTGAAIITTVCKKFGDFPKFTLEKQGLGAGTFNFKEPNILRLFIGEASMSFGEDLIVMIETNIDNMNPELYDHVINRLMKAGALDAYISQNKMKKNRPGVMLSVLSKLSDKDMLIDLIFSETTTLGVRTYLVKREILERTIRKVKTRYGKISIKIGKIGTKIKNIAPEYSDCARISKMKGIPLKLVYDEAKRCYERISHG